MKAVAPVQVELRGRPRADDERRLRVDGSRRIPSAGVQRIAGGDVELKPIRAKAQRAAQPRRPLQIVPHECSGRGLLNRVLSRRRYTRVDRRVIQADRADVVAPRVQSEQKFRRTIRDAPADSVGGAAAKRITTIGLLELIAIDGIIEKVSEVREQIEPIPDAIRGDTSHADGCRALPVPRKAVARRAAAERIIEAAKPVDAAPASTARTGI